MGFRSEDLRGPVGKRLLFVDDSNTSDRPSCEKILKTIKDVNV